MNFRSVFALFCRLLFSCCALVHPSRGASPRRRASSAYSTSAREAKLEEKFLAVPDAKLAGEELKTLTAEPHLAATPEDHKTAEYVARKFRAAGLETEIVPYRVLLN